jgi:hypothetical protein
MSGCGGARPTAPVVPRSYPPYTGEAAHLFDDGIDANAVGLADVAVDPRTDVRLRGRAQGAEVVGRVRVSTVTVDSIKGKPNYRLILALLDRPIARRGINEDHLEISIRSSSPGFGIAKWLDTGLIGLTFVGFFHRFADTDEAELRFHLSADRPDVLSAVRDASVLSELLAK